MSSWRPAQSEVVGGGHAKHGTVYRALVPIPCDWCARTIGVGEEFTRRSRGLVRDARWGRLLHNVCGRCGRPPERLLPTEKETRCDNAT